MRGQILTVFLLLGVICCVDLGEVRNDMPWMNKSLAPDQRAQLLLQAMDLDQKFHMLYGEDKREYVGYIKPIESLGIPPLNFQDGPQGVAHDTPNVTCWPSVLTVMSSFNQSLLYAYGKAIAEEMVKKGANIQLGPMINIARIPEGGRNFESMGEDPYLAGEMTYNYVKGVQDQGVIACAKHWVMNNQEYNRTKTSANADLRTFYEIYVPHFKRAIDAGVGSFMCSYNKINDTYACENFYTLQVTLKYQLGFQGWVMSDWGATHSAAESANAGLDQEMPTGEYFKETLRAQLEQNLTSITRINDMVYRILLPMFQMGLFDRKITGSLSSIATSPEHTLLARQFAAESIVLAKNQFNILPLDKSKLKKIAVLGKDASKPVYAGGGSGEVHADFVISPLDGITTQLKGYNVYIEHPTSQSTSSVKQACQNADAVIVVVSAKSGEGDDRKNLKLDNEYDQLIRNAVQFSDKNVIVVAYVPGAILMPWIDQVQAVLIPFLSGQEEGNALADILFGDVNPSAKLPITFPKTEQQVPANTTLRYPGIDNEAEYSEGLFVGYRWYIQQNQVPLFQFGHGLSYTQFKYNSYKISGTGFNLTISVNISNIGLYDGAEVAQLYIEYPSQLNEPTLNLKGFDKQLIKKGQSAIFTFKTTAFNFQYYDVAQNQYTSLVGNYVFRIGSSSSDIQLLAEWTITNKFKTYDSSLPIQMNQMDE